eukprot:2542295-Pyramimonas_sp.AAC.1
MMNSEHRSYISKAQMIFKPIVKLSSPECRLWPATCNVRGAGVTAVERQEEVPMLEWLFDNTCFKMEMVMATSTRMAFARRY